jgi:hypothetical protein
MPKTMTIIQRLILATALPILANGATNVSDVCIRILSVTNQMTVKSNWHYAKGRELPPTTNQADVLVEVQNRANHDIKLFEEWNSWGYCNLKFVFWAGEHEFWVSKVPGFWTRNFPSTTTLAPGAVLTIPVAFTEATWTGLDAVVTNRHMISEVRAIYEQHRPIGTGSFTPMVWEGMVTSDFYPASKLLPRFKFADMITTDDVVRPVVNDDIKVFIR